MRLPFFQPKHIVKRTYRVSTPSEIKNILSGRLSEDAVQIVLSYFSGYPVQLRIARQRHSKSGDFRPGLHENPPRITINGNLNNYSFLITLIHEIAHLYGMSRSRKLPAGKSRPNPHGNQWKMIFRQLMDPFLTSDVFPDSVLYYLGLHMKNPKASSSSDPDLSRALSKFDYPSGGMLLEELPNDATFRIYNGKLFQKKERLRKRYRCISIKDGRVYMINPVVTVFPSASSPLKI